MKLIDSVKDSYNELINKVTWPTWPELMNSAIVVFTASLLIALTVLVMDLVFQNSMDFIYKMLY
jgi:preprotein translocase subunit SecE